MTIGRDPDNDVVIDNAGVSRHHATIHYRGGAFEIRDEGSANGIFVNGERVTGLELEDGDSVQIGKFVLDLVAPDRPKLERPPPAAVLRSAALSNPQATTALGPAEIERMLRAAVKASTPSPVPAAAPVRRPAQELSPLPVARGNTVFAASAARAVANRRGSIAASVALVVGIVTVLCVGLYITGMWA